MIQQIRITDQIAVVTADVDFKPLNCLDVIAAELCKIKFSGKVLFDLLMFNGLSENRFFSMYFDGMAFSKGSLSQEQQLESNWVLSQDHALSRDPSFLEHTVLSKEELERFVLR